MPSYLRAFFKQDSLLFQGMAVLSRSLFKLFGGINHIPLRPSG